MRGLLIRKNRSLTLPPNQRLAEHEAMASVHPPSDWPHFFELRFIHLGKLSE